MLVNLLINLVLLIIGAVLSLPIFPKIDKFPTINGYDIDSALVTGLGQLHQIMGTFWIIKDVFYAFLFLLGYYGLKMVVKLFFGHRSPLH